MNPKRILFLTLVFSGLLFLSACVPETPTENNEEPRVPVETEDLNSDPYPNPGEEVIPPHRFNRALSESCH